MYSYRRTETEIVINHESLRRKQSNVPHFDDLQDSEGSLRSALAPSGKCPKQTNAIHLSGEGTLSQSQRYGLGTAFEPVGSGSSRRSVQESVVLGRAGTRGGVCENGSWKRFMEELEQKKLPPQSRKKGDEYEEDVHAWKAHPSLHSISRHGTVHSTPGHSKSRPSTQGSFHLSHLEGSAESDSSDDMEPFLHSDSSFSDVDRIPNGQHFPKTHRATPHPHISPRRTNHTNTSINHTHHSSRSPGLSWQKYKALAGREKRPPYIGTPGVLEGIRGSSEPRVGHTSPGESNAVDRERHQYVHNEQNHEWLDQENEATYLPTTGLHVTRPMGYHDVARVSYDEDEPLYITRTSNVDDDYQHFRGNGHDLLGNGNSTSAHGREFEYANRYNSQRPTISAIHGDEDMQSRVQESYRLPGLRTDQSDPVSQRSHYSNGELRVDGAMESETSTKARQPAMSSIMTRDEYYMNSHDAQRYDNFPGVPSALTFGQGGASTDAISLPSGIRSTNTRTVRPLSSSSSQKLPTNRKLEDYFKDNRSEAVSAYEPSEQLASGIPSRTFGALTASVLREGIQVEIDNDQGNPVFPLNSGSMPVLSRNTPSGQSAHKYPQSRNNILEQHKEEHSPHKLYPLQSQKGISESKMAYESSSLTTSGLDIYLQQGDRYDGTASEQSPTWQRTLPDYHDPVQDLLLTSSCTENSLTSDTHSSRMAQEQGRMPLAGKTAYGDGNVSDNSSTTSQDTVRAAIPQPAQTSTSLPGMLDEISPQGIYVNGHNRRQISRDSPRDISSEDSTLNGSNILQKKSEDSVPQMDCTLDSSQRTSMIGLNSRQLVRASPRSISSANGAQNGSTTLQKKSEDSVPPSSHNFPNKIHKKPHVAVHSARTGDWNNLSRDGSASTIHLKDPEYLLSEENRILREALARRRMFGDSMSYHMDDAAQSSQADSLNSAVMSLSELQGLDSKPIAAHQQSSQTASRYRTRPAMTASGSPRHTTSILWVFKLLDLLHNHPMEKHEVLVAQAYWFRRWHTKVRLLKLKRQEEEDKWRRAVTFHEVSLQQRCLHHWLAAVKSRSKSARLLYQQCLLQKGLRAFRFAVMRSRVQAIQLEKRLELLTLSHFFSKWKAITEVRREKETLLEQIASQHVTVKAFRAWKEGYQTQQRTGIADLHFKVGLLSKHFDGLKAYVSAQRQKFYHAEMARVFHEDRLVKKSWNTMATVFAERQKAKRQYRRSTLVRAWKAWMQGIQLMKMENLHDHTQALVFRQHGLLRRFFAEWQDRKRFSQITHQRAAAQLRQTFQLWRLKLDRRRLICRILASKHRAALKQKAFTEWMERTRKAREAREKATALLKGTHTRVVLAAWRKRTRTQICHRAILERHTSALKLRTERAVWHVWRAGWRRRRSMKDGMKRWSVMCVQRAVQTWKQRVDHSRLRQKAEDFRTRTERSQLRRAFSVWMAAKETADNDRQRAEEAWGVIARNQLHRTLLAWRLEMMESRAMHPLTDRRKKRCIARAFDGWREVILRKKDSQKMTEACETHLVARHFNCWRDQTHTLQQSRKKEEEEHQASLIHSCFEAWRKLHEREVNRKGITGRGEDRCLREAFTSWRSKFEEAELEREVQLGEEKRNLVLQKMFFQSWRRVSGEDAKSDEDKCDVIQDRMTQSVLSKAWKQWKVSLDRELKARSFEERVHHRLLLKVFLSWQRYTQQSIADAIDRFEQRLNDSCASLPSPTLLDTLPASLSPPSSSSSSSGDSPSSLSPVMNHHGNQSPCPYALSPSPLRELSENAVRSLEQEPLGFGDRENILLYDPVQMREGNGLGVSPPSSDGHSHCTSPAEVTRTPSPLHNLPRHRMSTLRRVENSWTHLQRVGGIGKTEFPQGGIVNLEEFQHSSVQHVDSQSSVDGIASVADSGYSGNGAPPHSNGESVSSREGASLKSATQVTERCEMSPHRNNNNSGTPLEQMLTLTRCASNSAELPGEAETGNPSHKLHTSSDKGRMNGEMGQRLVADNGFSNHGNVRGGVVNGAVLNGDPVEDRPLANGTAGILRQKEEEEEEKEDGMEEKHNGFFSSSPRSDETFPSPVGCTAPLPDRQTLAAIADRKAYLTSAILRLRLWPASAAFYQWLDHTRLQKERQRQRTRVEDRRRLVELRATFAHWRRCADERQVAFSQSQPKRSLPIGPCLDESTEMSESEHLSQMAESFQEQIHSQNVRECFLFWRLRGQQIQQADQYRSDVILRRSLQSWLSWTQEKRQRETAAQNMLETRRKRLAFHHWKERLGQLNLVYSHYHGAAHSHLCLVLRLWHEWAESQHRLHLSHQSVQLRLDAAMIRQAWAVWKQQVEKSLLARKFQSGHLLRRCLIGWKSAIQVTKQNRQTLDSIHQTKATSALTAYFSHWWMEYKARQFAREKEQKHAWRVMEAAMATWKEFLTERRCIVRDQKDTLRKAFSAWKYHHTTTKRSKQLALYAATKWQHMVRRSCELNGTMVGYQASVEERRRKQTFLHWQRAWISSRLAEFHYNSRLKRRVLESLQSLVMETKHHHQLEQELRSRNQKAMLALCFHKWKERQSRMITLHVTAEQVKGQLANKSLAAAFYLWSLQYQEKRVVCTYQQGLVAKVWQRWKTSLMNQQRVDAVRRAHQFHLLKKCFQALRTWAIDRSGRRIVLQCVQSKRDHFTLKNTFMVWRAESTKMHMAKEHHMQRLQRKILVSWAQHSQRKKCLTALCQQGIWRGEERCLGDAFRRWRKAYEVARINQSKLLRFTHERDQRLVARCFVYWREQVLETQARRFREQRLAMWVRDRWRRKVETQKLVREYERDLEELAELHRVHTLRKTVFSQWRASFEVTRHQRRCHYLEMKYGVMWKRLVSQRLMAEAVARYWRLQHCWVTWRRAFILEQVSQRMMRQDQRCLMAKVFCKWREVIQEEDEDISISELRH